jgi:hypothetical protein
VALSGCGHRTLSIAGSALFAADVRYLDVAFQLHGAYDQGAGPAYAQRRFRGRQANGAPSQFPGRCPDGRLRGPGGGSRPRCRRNGAPFHRYSKREDGNGAAFSTAYPELSITAYYGVLRDRETGRLSKYFFDQDGRPTSPSELQVRSLQARRDSDGIMGPRLKRALDSFAPDQMHSVIVAFEVPALDKPEPLWNEAASSDILTAAERDLDAGLAQAYAQPRTRALKLLHELNADILEAPDAASFILARMPGDAVRDLAQRAAGAGIISIEAPTDEREVFPLSEFFYGSDDLEAKEVFLDLNKRGNGIRVGLFEMVGGCGIWYDYVGASLQPLPFKDWSGYEQQAPSAVKGCDTLPDGAPCLANCNNTTGFCRRGHCAARHSTAVASHIGASYVCPTLSCSTNQDRLANEAHIYFAQDKSVVDRLNWFASNDVRIVNHSETPAATDAVNFAVRTNYLLVTHAAGNTTGVVYCYANAICVGAARPLTVNDTDSWKTDPQGIAGRFQVVPGFSYGNGYQLNGIADVEKPDIMAIDNTPGADVAIADWTNFGGTSLAAPKIAGLVALMQEQAPFLRSWPELVRPLLMAASVSHDVEGKQLSTYDGPDENDGAGMPAASVAQEIMNRKWYEKGLFVPADFEGSKPYTGPAITLGPGQGVRVVLGWLHCSENYSDTSNNEFLAADFDLYLEVKGQTVASSLSYHNNLEALEYVNNSGSVMTADVRVRTWGPWQSCGKKRQEYYGLAWVRHRDYLLDEGDFARARVASTFDPAHCSEHWYRILYPASCDEWERMIERVRRSRVDTNGGSRAPAQ